MRFVLVFFVLVFCSSPSFADIYLCADYVRDTELAKTGQLENKSKLMLHTGYMIGALAGRGNADSDHDLSKFNNLVLSTCGKNLKTNLFGHILFLLDQHYPQPSNSKQCEKLFNLLEKAQEEKTCEN